MSQRDCANAAAFVFFKASAFFNATALRSAIRSSSSNLLARSAAVIVSVAEPAAISCIKLRQRRRRSNVSNKRRRARTHAPCRSV